MLSVKRVRAKETYTKNGVCYHFEFNEIPNIIFLQFDVDQERGFPNQYDINVADFIHNENFNDFYRNYWSESPFILRELNDRKHELLEFARERTKIRTLLI